MSYCDLDSLKTWLSAGSDSAVTLTGDDEATLQRLLDTATDWIARYTGRSFAAEPGAAKIFLPTSTSHLDLSPDIRVVTAVALDTAGDGTYATALAASDYLLVPLNPQPDPGIYNRLRIAPNSSKAFGVHERVRVTGDWGYVLNGQAPQAVQTACLLQSARWWTRKSAPLGILQNVDLGTFSRLSKLDPDVSTLLDPFKAVSADGAWLMV